LLLDLRKSDTGCDCFLPGLHIACKSLVENGAKKIGIRVNDAEFARTTNFIFMGSGDSSYMRFFADTSDEEYCLKWLRQKN